MRAKWSMLFGPEGSIILWPKGSILFGQRGQICLAFPLINDSFCDKVFKTVIRDNVALAEAPIKGLNIFEYNKNSNGAKDYMDLALEVLKLK